MPDVTNGRYLSVSTPAKAFAASKSKGGCNTVILEQYLDLKMQISEVSITSRIWTGFKFEVDSNDAI